MLNRLRNSIHVCDAFFAIESRSLENPHKSLFRTFFGAQMKLAAAAL